MNEMTKQALRRLAKEYLKREVGIVGGNASDAMLRKFRDAYGGVVQGKARDVVMDRLLQAKPGSTAKGYLREMARHQDRATYSHEFQDIKAPYIHGGVSTRSEWWPPEAQAPGSYSLLHTKTPEGVKVVGGDETFYPREERAEAERVYPAEAIRQIQHSGNSVDSNMFRWPLHHQADEVLVPYAHTARFPHPVFTPVNNPYASLPVSSLKGSLKMKKTLSDKGGVSLAKLPMSYLKGEGLVPDLYGSSGIFHGAGTLEGWQGGGLPVKLRQEVGIGAHVHPIAGSLRGSLQRHLQGKGGLPPTIETDMQWRAKGGKHRAAGPSGIRTSPGASLQEQMGDIQAFASISPNQRQAILAHDRDTRKQFLGLHRVKVDTNSGSMNPSVLGVRSTYFDLSPRRIRGENPYADAMAKAEAERSARK